MKRMIKRIEKLGQKAALVQQAVSAVPGKIADIRESVAMTRGQLQQLRADVQSTVADLRMDSEERLLGALMEINGSKDALHQAGYDLVGVDMELSPSYRLIVHLRHVDEVSPAALQSVIAANQGRKITHALLLSLERAETVARKVDLEDLVYSEVIVHIGPVPSLRLAWRAEELEPETPPAIPSVPTPASPPPTPSPFFGQSSFFERRSTPTPLVAAPTAPAQETRPGPEASAAQPAASTPGSSAGSSDWKKSALDRFKRMPDFSKYR